MNSLLVLVMFVTGIVLALAVGFFVGHQFGNQLLPMAVHALNNVSVTR